MKRSGSSDRGLTRLPQVPAQPHPQTVIGADSAPLNAIVVALVSWEGVQTRCQELLP